jgi:hypothetical protein
VDIAAHALQEIAQGFFEYDGRGQVKEKVSA